MDKLPADWVPEQTILRLIFYGQIVLHFLICLEVSRNLNFQEAFQQTTDNMLDMESKQGGMEKTPIFILGQGLINLVLNSMFKFVKAFLLEEFGLKVVDETDPFIWIRRFVPTYSKPYLY